MAFLDTLREYLERPEPASAAFTPDSVAHRARLLRVLEELARSGTEDREVERLHEEWSERIDIFAREMGTMLLDGLAHGANRDVVTSLIDIAVSRDLGIQASTGSKVKDREIDRLRTLALDKTDDQDIQRMAERYALEIRAVRRSGESRITTPIGKLIIELPDRDAMRWMLAVEAVQSHGDEDEWRLSRASAAKLLENPEGYRNWYDVDRMPLPVSSNALLRLAKMGIVALVYGIEPPSANYTVLPERRLLLQEIASGRSTPFIVLAQALLEDETASVIGQFRPVAELVQSEGAAAATTRHARMVAHEIRNALVPVQVAIGAFYRDLERRGEGMFIEQHRSAIDGGIDRIFTFVKEMVNVAARGAEPTEPFDVTPAIEGAIAAVASDLGLKVSFEPPGTLPPIVGHRSRFTLAIINLLRNAAQTRAERDVEVHIAADMSADGDSVVLSVDDDGPGVPPEFREAIFQRGVSLRPGGEGAGEGLALVREVVETEMGGRATCEQSPSGGARLVLRISVNGRRTGG